jgi:hypothetical protein
MRREMTDDSQSLTLGERRLTLEGAGVLNLTPLVDEVDKRKWKRVQATGDLELVSTFWLEATLKGIEVQGYTPNLGDRELLKQRWGELEASRVQAIPLVVVAGWVAVDLEGRVIPHVKKQLEENGERLRKLSFLEQKQELSAQYSQFQSSHEMFLAHLKIELLRFRELGDQSITVTRKFEFGISRYVLDREHDLKIAK